MRRKHHTRGRWLITNVQPDSKLLFTCSWRENCVEGKLRGRSLVPLSQPCGWAPPPAVLADSAAVCCEPLLWEPAALVLAFVSVTGKHR